MSIPSYPCFSLPNPCAAVSCAWSREKFLSETTVNADYYDEYGYDGHDGAGEAGGGR